MMISDQQSGLTHMRRVASGLVLISAVAFILCMIFQSFHPLIGVLRGGFEGAMIGGLADWFAVTALFRHPLGIPIPHTALIQKRKNEIGKQLGRFIRVQFLRPRSILDKWRAMGFYGHLEKWLLADGSVGKLMVPVFHYVADWLDQQAEKGMDQLTVARIDEFWKSQNLTTRLHSLVQHILTPERREMGIDRALAMADDFLDNKGDAIGRYLASELQKSGKPIVAGFFEENWPGLKSKIQAKIYRARDEKDFPLRLEISKIIGDLIYDDQLVSRIESGFFGILRDPDVEKMLDIQIRTQLEKGLRGLSNHLRTHSNDVAKTLENIIQQIWTRWMNDSAFRSRVERGTESLLLRTVRRYSFTVEQYIATEVAEWDGEQTANLIEQQVGKDLQWIRINGSVIGFFAGSLIQLGVLFAAMTHG